MFPETAVNGEIFSFSQLSMSPEIRLMKLLMGIMGSSNHFEVIPVHLHYTLNAIDSMVKTLHSSDFHVFTRAQPASDDPCCNSTRCGTGCS
jgi:hypothetical protein